MAKRLPKVLMIPKSVAHYREPFYEALFDRFQEKEIDLELLYGIPRTGFARTVPYGTPFRMRVLFGKVYWLPVLWRALKSDLVIAEHTGSSLINYFLFAAQYIGGPKVALWGHGRNHQTDEPNSFSERIKTWMARHCRWYFAYTGRIREELIERGFDPDRVTNVQNAVEKPDVSPAQSDIDQIREELGLTEDSVVGFYCSQMYPRKRLELMVDAAKAVHAKVPSFRMVLAGGGISAGIAEQAAQEYDFIDYVGPQFGSRKSAYYSLARFIAFPGVLGLGLVEAFHYGVPPVVADNRHHGPEFSYLVENENALLTRGDAAEFADGIVRICQDDQLHATLKNGGEKWSNVFTIDAMADRFAAGIEGALEDRVPAGRFVA